MVFMDIPEWRTVYGSEVDKKSRPSSYWESYSGNYILPCFRGNLTVAVSFGNGISHIGTSVFLDSCSNRESFRGILGYLIEREDSGAVYLGVNDEAYEFITDEVTKREGEHMSLVSQHLSETLFGWHFEKAGEGNESLGEY